MKSEKIEIVRSICGPIGFSGKSETKPKVLTFSIFLG
jgi:hypothetical protein